MGWAMRVSRVLVAVLLIELIRATPIDNELTVEPYITCGSDTISMTINVKNPFSGNLYVKDHFNETSCKVVGDSKQSLSILVGVNGPCGVRRHRSITPNSGISIEVTIVVMFHPVVLTKVDRAFNVRCFYMQAEKVVTASLDVSMLTTSAITEAVPMPTCHYHVLTDGPHGTPIKFAQIGQAVYHKWLCTNGDYRVENGAYCMTVHTCTVDDGHGNSVLLLDDIGCAQDRYLLQNLDYISDNVAGQESHVFKFADKAQVYFTCQIRITVKEYDHCERPQCPAPTRGKRSTGQILMEQNGTRPSQLIPIGNQTERRLLADFDISASKLMVWDIEDNSSSKETSSELSLIDSKGTPRRFCIDPVIVGVLVSLIVVLALISFLVSVAWYRASNRKRRAVAGC